MYQGLDTFMYQSQRGRLACTPFKGTTSLCQKYVFYLLHFNISLGRSDGTLNPSGVRFGSAEIYNIVEQFTEVRKKCILSLSSQLFYCKRNIEIM